MLFLYSFIFRAENVFNARTISDNGLYPGGLIGAALRRVGTGLRQVGAGLKPAPTCCKPAPICCNHAPVRPTRYKPLSEIVRALKTFSARKINEYRNSIGTPIWQRNYYEHIIRTEQSYLKIADYIKTNPQNWIEDTLYVVKSKDGDCRR